MAKNTHASSRPGEPTLRKSGDIWSKPLSAKEKVMLARHAAKHAAGDDSDLDLGDTPGVSDSDYARALTDKQLQQVLRIRQEMKVSVNVRLDPRVLTWLKAKGPGHITRINSILMNLMELEESRAK